MKDEKVVYKGKVFTITQSKFVDKKGVKHIIEKGYRPNIVTIIGITADYKILLIKEFRPGPKDYILWLPGGKVEEGENFKEAALREFEEETGYTSKELTLFHKRQLSDNFHGQGKVYLAKNISRLTRNATIDMQKEKKYTQEIPILKAKKMALKGQIPNEFFGYLIIKLNYLTEEGGFKT